jgi:tetrahydromethanopterin S-methyltransferase subunit B
MIETMVQAGDVMGAQKIILAELNKEFGGSAVAAAQTFSGQMEILKNQVGELQETLGKAIVTAITPFVTQLAAFAGREDVQEKFQAIAQGIGNFIAKAFEAIGVVINFGQTLWSFASDLIAKLKPALDLIWIIVQQQLLPVFQELWNAIKNDLWPAIQELWQALLPFMPLLEQFAKLLGIAVVAAILLAVGVLTKLLTVGVEVLTLLTQIATLISKVVVAAWKNFEDSIVSVINSFKSLIDIAKKAKDAVTGFIDSKAVSSVGKALGFRAAGGPVTSGSPYIVGERGPELFVPNRSGTIIPNSGLAGAPAGGINIFITGTFMSEDAAEIMGNKMIDRLKLQLRI